MRKKKLFLLSNFIYKIKGTTITPTTTTTTTNTTSTTTINTTSTASTTTSTTVYIIYTVYPLFYNILGKVRKYKSQNHKINETKFKFYTNLQ